MKIFDYLIKVTKTQGISDDCRLSNADRFPTTADYNQSPPILLIVLLFLVFLPPAYAQGSGVIEGKLTNGTDASIIAGGTMIEVIGLGGRMSIIASATADPDGRFRIDALPASEPLIVRANYKGVNYHGQANFDKSGKSYVEIEVFEPTTSMRDIRVEDFRITFQLLDDRLLAVESVTLNNTTAPARTCLNREGNFRVTKLPGILEVPQLRITAPGSSMPLVQPALESADGRYYYSLYPLRPGVTTFEVRQLLPYKDGSYTYAKRFYHGVDSIDVVVIPQDMDLSGKELSKIGADTPGNFSVYDGSSIKAGSEVTWILSGGTAPAEEESAAASAESAIRAMPDAVARNALTIGPLLLIGFIAVLWYAYNRLDRGQPEEQDIGAGQLKEHRDQMLEDIISLDHQYEARALDRQEYLKRREEKMKQLRRIFELVKKA